jgi:hypothetical protein
MRPRSGYDHEEDAFACIRNRVVVGEVTMLGENAVNVRKAVAACRQSSINRNAVGVFSGAVATTGLHPRLSRARTPSLT